MGFSIRRSKDFGTAPTLPAGVINPYAGATAPTGWLLCFGQAVSRSTYAELFSAIGTTYGSGDGSTTFNLPDMRGRIAAGKDDMGGVAASRLTNATITSGAATLGNSGGAQTHSLTSGESGVPAHSHANTLASNTVASAGHQHAEHLMHSTTNGGSGGVAYAPWNDPVWGISPTLKTYANRQGYSMAGAEGSSVSGYPYLTSSELTASTTVTISNVNNNTANASSAHNNVQPTIILNYIIKV